MYGNLHSVRTVTLTWEAGRVEYCKGPLQPTRLLPCAPPYTLCYCDSKSPTLLLARTNTNIMCCTLQVQGACWKQQLRSTGDFPPLSPLPSISPGTHALHDLNVSQDHPTATTSVGLTGDSSPQASMGRVLGTNRHRAPETQHKHSQPSNCV